MLAHLPPAQVRALLPAASSFVDRTGRGPHDLPALRRKLAMERRRGWAVEDGHVTRGFASVAAPVFDHWARPTAAISVTFRHLCGDGESEHGHGDLERGDLECGQDWPALAAEVRRTADELTARIGGHLTC
jgi:DNA-binding IclR family transcriptional regulator